MERTIGQQVVLRFGSTIKTMGSWAVDQSLDCDVKQLSLSLFSKLGSDLLSSLIGVKILNRSYTSEAPLRLGWKVSQGQTL